MPPKKYYEREILMSTMLLSIKPEFVEYILEGKKI
jgi:hypothetical protein